MGLDSVELVLAIEEEFAIDIDNEHSSKMFTVGDAFDYLKLKIKVTPSFSCPSQRCFYRLRQSIASTYNVPRNQIKLKSKLTDFMSSKDVRDGWPYLELYGFMRVPEDERLGLFSRERISETLTIEQLVESVLPLNPTLWPVEPGSEEELWGRLVKVIVRQIAVSPGLVTKNARFGADLGVS